MLSPSHRIDSCLDYAEDLKPLACAGRYSCGETRTFVNVARKELYLAGAPINDIYADPF